jgi:cell division protein FtsI (penicillin-binding protein 3)
MVGVVLIGVWGALILGQLVQIQVLDHETMVRRADRQHRHELTIPPFRGRIYDRNGRPLALTVAVDSVYVVPPDYSAATIPAAAERLAECLEVPVALVERRLRRESRFSWLKRKAEAEQVTCARETGFPVGTIEEFGRFYPGGELAAHVLGFVGADGDGLGGIEFARDQVLRGEPGRRTVWTDGRRTGRGSRVVRESRPGADIELTIDAYLQAVAEEELARALTEIPAASGAVILVEPRTGEVLAMASAPSFDPNRAGEFPLATLANRSITDPYEPGSVFKIFTAAAALEEGVTDEEEEFETFDGSYRIGGRIVRDWKPLGPLTFAGIIQQSSNIGTLQVADRIGSETLQAYLAAFGFGEPTGLPLGAESRGIVPGRGLWRPIRLATVSFGHGIAVTPVQLVRGVNAVATGGVRRPLRLIRGIGGEVQPPEDGLQVISPMTAARVSQLLASAVQEGTGSNAAVAGFSVAGKTGTAQKAEAGGYSDTDYTASFAGFAPARNPLFTGVVILDVQRPNHSGTGAAAVFGRIADRVLWRDRRTGWGTERLVSSGPRVRQLARKGRSRAASAMWSSKAAAGSETSARDLVASRVRMAEASDPTTSETTLIAEAAATPSGLHERPVRSAIAESPPPATPGSPEGGPAAADPERGTPAPREPSLENDESRPR